VRLRMRRGFAAVHRLVQREHPCVAASPVAPERSGTAAKMTRRAERVVIEPAIACARGRIPWAIVCHLGFSERRDEGGASEALGQPVKILTMRSVILDPLAATTRAPVLGAAGKPGGRADAEANMSKL